MTNETDLATPATTAGAVSGPATRVLSDADLALFALLSGHLDLRGDVALSLEVTPRQPVPHALLAALLTAEALRVAGDSAHARVTSAALRFPEQAYTDEELRISANHGNPDPAGALHVAVEVQSADGRPLAAGTILVLPG